MWEIVAGSSLVGEFLKRDPSIHDLSESEWRACVALADYFGGRVE